jgi:hypothetical protein
MADKIVSIARAGETVKSADVLDPAWDTFNGGAPSVDEDTETEESESETESETEESEESESESETSVAESEQEGGFKSDDSDEYESDSQADSLDEDDEDDDGEYGFEDVPPESPDDGFEPDQDDDVDQTHDAYRIPNGRSVDAETVRALSEDNVFVALTSMLVSQNDNTLADVLENIAVDLHGIHLALKQMARAADE